MKNTIYIILVASILLSCSVNKPIEMYIKNEVSENAKKNIESVLFDKKRNSMNVLDTYIGVQIGNIDSRAKSFKQEDYDFMLKIYKNDVSPSYWKECERRKFSFSKLIIANEERKQRILQRNDSIVYFYQISNPLFIKNKTHALFSIIISRGPGWILDDYVIIMKKEKGKWVFLEKVYNTALY